MTTAAKWKWLILTTCLFPMLAASCSMTLRDAVLSGGIDFVSGTVTAALEALLPIARVLQPA
jgi:hypothetical protein